MTFYSLQHLKYYLTIHNITGLKLDYVITTQGLNLPQTLFPFWICSPLQAQDNENQQTLQCVASTQLSNIYSIS